MIDTVQNIFKTLCKYVNTVHIVQYCIKLKKYRPKMKVNVGQQVKKLSESTTFSADFGESLVRAIRKFTDTACEAHKW